MSYIGNTPDVNAYTIGTIDRFSGTGACTQFTLSKNIGDSKAVEVLVNNVQQDPDNSYSVSNGIITFTEPPAASTNNIQVIYRVTSLVTYSQVFAGQLQANSVNETALQANSITSTKFANLVIDGSKYGPSSVSGNNIGTGAISGNQIGTYAVSGNNIGLGAISANNFAGGGITSNVLSANLQISTTRIAETINLTTSSVTANYNVHVGNTTVYYFAANSAGNVTFNLIANNGALTGTTGKLNDLISIGQTSAVAIIFKQGSIRYRANIAIDGIIQQAYWLGNSQPLYQDTQQQSIDVYNLITLKTGDGAFTVLASNSSYAQANGQGIRGSVQ